MDNNFLPDLDKLESTSTIKSFFDDLNLLMVNKYNSKIKCSLEKIIMKEKVSPYESIVKSLDAMRIPLEQSSQNFYEIKSDPEKKEEIRILVKHNLKFIIYSEKYFYRLFDIKYDDFFPIEIIPSYSIFENHTTIKIQNKNELEHQVKEILNNENVLKILTFLLDN